MHYLDATLHRFPMSGDVPHYLIIMLQKRTGPRYMGPVLENRFLFLYKGIFFSVRNDSLLKAVSAVDWKTLAPGLPGALMQLLAIPHCGAFKFFLSFFLSSKANARPLYRRKIGLENFDKNRDGRLFSINMQYDATRCLGFIARDAHQHIP